jgi:hypothetical protein
MKPVVGKIPVETEEGKVGAMNELAVGAVADVLLSVGAEDPAPTKPDVWAVAPAAATGSIVGV